MCPFFHTVSVSAALSISVSKLLNVKFCDMSVLCRLGMTVRLSSRLPQPLSRGYGSAAGQLDSEKPLGKMNTRGIAESAVVNTRGTALVQQGFNLNSSPYTKKALAGLRRIDLEGLRWRVFDAKGQVLGRLASQVSTVVQGKDKPTYTPNRDDGDMCIVINAKDVCVTGRKMTDKVYHWHTGYIGHLKERTLKDQMAKDPTEVIRKAVLRMLPRNKLRDDRDRKLRIFAGCEHPFGDRPVEAYEMPPRQVREMRPRARRALIRAQKKTEQQVLGATTNIKKGKKRKEVKEEINE